MWLSFSPVPSVTADFYHITLAEVDWFSQSYFVASLVVGFLAIAVLDVCGLRLSVSATTPFPFTLLCLLTECTCTFLVCNFSDGIAVISM